MVPFGLHAGIHNDACIQCADAIRKQGNANDERSATFASVFDAIADSPEHAAELKEWAAARRAKESK